MGEEWLAAEIRGGGRWQHMFVVSEKGQACTQMSFSATICFGTWNPIHEYSFIPLSERQGGSMKDAVGILTSMLTALCICRMAEVAIYGGKPSAAVPQMERTIEREMMRLRVHSQDNKRFQQHKPGFQVNYTHTHMYAANWESETGLVLLMLLLMMLLLLNAALLPSSSPFQLLFLHLLPSSSSSILLSLVVSVPLLLFHAGRRDQQHYPAAAAALPAWLLHVSASLPLPVCLSALFKVNEGSKNPPLLLSPSWHLSLSPSLQSLPPLPHNLFQLFCFFGFFEMFIR
uniref:Uncharacterized protein n=1 Tax=Physcomitrium patens TaxID=3218 RepID=A0A7I4FT45_PHYPA